MILTLIVIIILFTVVHAITWRYFERRIYDLEDYVDKAFPVTRIDDESLRELRKGMIKLTEDMAVKTKGELRRIK